MNVGDYDPLMLPQSAEQMDRMMNNLVFTDEVIDPESIPRPEFDEPIMVVTSMRLTLDVLERVKAVADKRGQKFTLLMREWVELMLADAEADAPLSEADALAAIAALRKVGKIGNAA